MNTISFGSTFHFRDYRRDRHDKSKGIQLGQEVMQDELLRFDQSEHGQFGCSDIILPDKLDGFYVSALNRNGIVGWKFAELQPQKEGPHFHFRDYGRSRNNIRKAAMAAQEVMGDTPAQVDHSEHGQFGCADIYIPADKRTAFQIKMNRKGVSGWEIVEGPGRIQTYK